MVFPADYLKSTNLTLQKASIPFFLKRNLSIISRLNSRPNLITLKKKKKKTTATRDLVYSYKSILLRHKYYHIIMSKAPRFKRLYLF